MNEQWVTDGERITKLRKNLRLTQEKLAEQADISIQFLVRIEHGINIHFSFCDFSVIAVTSFYVVGFIIALTAVVVNFYIK